MIKISQSAFHEISQFAKNNSYSNIIDDIKKVDFKLVVLTGTIIYKDNELTLYKIRISNSNNNKGKRAGYRILVLKKDDNYFILKVYPKTGPYGKQNISYKDINLVIQNSKKETFISLF